MVGINAGRETPPQLGAISYTLCAQWSMCGRIDQVPLPPVTEDKPMWRGGGDLARLRGRNNLYKGVWGMGLAPWSIVRCPLPKTGAS
jgi:hypothetical protein